MLKNMSTCVNNLSTFSFVTVDGRLAFKRIYFERLNSKHHFYSKQQRNNKGGRGVGGGARVWAGWGIAYHTDLLTKCV